MEREMDFFSLDGPLSNLDGFELEPSTQNSNNSNPRRNISQQNISPNIISNSQYQVSHLCNSQEADTEQGEYSNLMSAEVTRSNTRDSVVVSRFNSTNKPSSNSNKSFRAPRSKPKKKSSLGMLSDLNWSKKVGNIEILKSQQILYKLIQKHMASHVEAHMMNSR
mmetsp:Transcript_10278/g.10621  ORF Transcript_10278/g.10621 Transcript_10278/m.10621 type:complete len:165 (-) Transcript_10278:232-726(-)